FGQFVVEELEARGAVVVTAGRNRPLWRDGMHAHVDLSDANSVSSLPRAAGDVQRVVHLAAAVPLRAADDDPERMIVLNELSTVRLIEAYGSGLERFVLASTAEVYGGVPGPRPAVGEDQPVDPPSAYATSKLAAEMQLRLAAVRLGIGWAALRYTVLYGGHDRIARAIPAFITDALGGKQPTVVGGEEQRDYLHVREAARATALAATSRSSGVYNIGSGRTTTIYEAALAIADMVQPGLGVEVVPKPEPGVHVTLDVRRAERDLGFRAEHHFPWGMEEQLEWQRARL
ncbi:MAG TPA: NAD(P)-dependent oxidoreductase, partial [Burkholderiaceae bacterium]|nr:NAD(P)-dependent oxidoreductase [Burkholderiaceae bacterium]